MWRLLWLLAATFSPLPDMTDTQGHRQKLTQPDGKAAVIFFVTSDCPIANYSAREINRICAAYGSHARCYLDYVEPDLTPKQVSTHMTDYGHGDYPAFIDGKQLLVKALGATVTPEAALVLPDGTLAYRGKIDNQYASPGVRRTQVTEKYLRDALDAVVAGKPVAVPRTNPIGCFIPPVRAGK